MSLLLQIIDATTGTVMLSALPIILGVQFLLQAISIDIEIYLVNNNKVGNI